MKKLLLLLLIPFLGMTTTLKADNVLSIGDYQGDPGDVITVSVSLANDENNIAGFQFDVPMNGFSFVNGSAVKSSRLPAQFILLAQIVANGNLRVLAYSMPGTNIPGNDGEIMTFQITLGDTEGVFPIELEQMVLSDIQGHTLDVSGINGSVIIGNPTVTYDITLSANPADGGSVNGAGTYNAGEEVTVTATPFDGYSFVNWTEDGTAVSADAAYTFTVTSDRYLVANFEENIVYYTVTLSANPADGGSVNGAGTYEEGTSVTVTATPAEGYSFVNWTEDGTAVSADAAYTFTISGNRTLVANFNVVIPTVNILSIGDYSAISGAETTISVNLNNSDDVVAFQLDIPLDASLSYVSGSAALTSRATANHFMTAQVVSNNTLRFIVYSMPSTPFIGENGAIVTFDITGSVAGTYALDMTNAILSDAQGQSLSIEIVNGSIEILPLPTYTINAGVYPEGAGTVTGAGEYEEGETATLTATAIGEYYFVNWTEGETEVSTDATYSFVVTEDRNLVANFTASSMNILSIGDYTGAEGEILTIDINLANEDVVSGFQFDIPINEGFTYVEGSIVTGERCSPYHIILAQLVNNGAALRVLCYAMPPANVSGNDGAIASLQILLGGAGTYELGLTGCVLSTMTGGTLPVIGIGGTLTVTGGQTVTYTVTATVNPVGAGTVTGAGEYEEGETATLVATANSGYDFVNWTEGGTEVSTDATYSFVVTGDRALVANFEIPVVYYTVTATVNPAGTGTVTGAGVYEEGATATLAATASSGFYFVNWTENGTVVSNSEVYSFVVTEDRNLVANFTQFEGNYLSIGNYNGVYNQTITAGVNLTNGDEVAGLQMDIPLDDNLTYAEGTIALTDRATANHVIYAGMVSNHVLRVIVYSMPSTPFIGTTGDIFTFGLTLGTESGIFPLPVENAILSDVSGNSLPVDASNGSVTVVEPEMFEITATAVPNAAAIIEGVGIHAEQSTATLTVITNTGYEFVNWTENGEVISTDETISFVVLSDRHFVVNFNVTAGNILSIGDESGLINTNTTISVNMDNVDGVSGLQFDVVLPEGITYVDGSAALTDRASANHILVAGMINPVTLRFLAYAMPYGYFSGTTGDVVTFQVTGSEEGTYALPIDNPALSDHYGNLLPVGTYDGTLTLTNQIQPQTYTITAAANPAEGGTVTGAGEYNEGTIATLVATSASGYYFVNWTEDGEIVSTNSTYSFTVTSDRALVANFAESSGNMMILSNESGTDGSTVTMTVDMVNIDDISGFQFDIVMNEHISFVEGSVALTERATPYHILIAQLVQDGAILRVLCYSMPGANFEGHSGPIATFDLVITGEEGVTYTVDLDNAVISTIQGHTPEVIAVDGSVTIVSGEYYTITATANPAEGGSVLGGGIYSPGEVVTVFAAAADGYEFTNWTEDGVVVSTTPTYSFTATSDRDLVANFIPTSVTTYTITATANPADGGTVTGAGVYNEGTIATLVATSATGYYFANWTEDGNVVSTSSTYSFIVTSDRALVANFTEASSNMMILSNESGTDGSTVTMSVDMINLVDISGFQFDIVMNEHISFVEGSVALTERATPYHILIAQLVQNGTRLRVLCYSMPGANFEGSSGPIATFDLVITGEEGVTYTVDLDNAVISTIQGHTPEVIAIDGSVTVIPGGYYTITTTANPSEGGSVMGGGIYYPGDVVTVYASAADGYEFANWTEDGVIVSTTASYTFTAEGDRNLVANFTPVATDMYHIYLVCSPYQGGFATGGGVYTFGEEITVTATPNTGYTFYSWTENGSVVSYSSSYSFVVTADRTLTAVFQPKNYTVTATANPTQGGTVTGSGMYPYGNIATVTAAPHTGYNFVSWSINGEIVSLEPSYSFTVFADVFVTGNFEKKNMTVALTAVPVNAAETLTGAGVYKYGTSVTISTSPVTGYDFVNWTEYGDVISTNASYTFTITDNHSFTANFTLKTFDVTTSVVPAAGGSVTGAGSYYYNQEVTLFATPNTGYSFLNWSVNGTIVSNQPQYIFQITQDVNFVATFEINTYYVSINVTPYNGGTASGEGYYDYGTRVTVHATPNENYRFVEWMVNNESVSTNESYTFTISEDMRFIAVFSYDDGIDPNSSLNASVYPNPTTDIVNVKCEGMKNILILTNNGEKVNSISEINANEYPIDMTQYGSGTYIIRIETTYGIITKKFVKM